MSALTLQASLLRVPLMVADACGLPREAVLTAAGGAHGSRPEERLPAAVFIRAVVFILQSVDDPERITRAMADFPLEALGLPGFIMRSCPTLGAAYQRLTAYQYLLHSARHATIVDHDDGALLTFRLPAAVGEHAAQLLGMRLVVAVAMGRRLTGVSWSPVAASLPVLPVEASIWSSWLGCAITQQAGPARLIIGRDVLALPISTGQSDMLAWLEAEAQRRLPVVEPEAGIHSVAEALRVRLKSQGSWQTPDAARLAREMGMSRRTLFRRLREEGTTLGTVRADVQRKTAEALLRDTDHNHSTIAVLIGFSDGRSFARAFRRWHGCSPSVWRAQQRPG